MGLLIKIGQLILSLSILVVLHELGHFLPARWFKTRVEKFYLFFDPYFSLFKKKIGDTEYGVGWLPLGGYVKISGMVDESLDMEAMKQPAQPWEFRSKPAWQRLIIMLGGVTVNFLLGIFIFSMIFYAYGEEYIPTKNAKFGITVEEFGKEIGLQNGDKIKSVGGKPFEILSDQALKFDIILNSARDIVVDRAGVETKIDIKQDVVEKLMAYENREKSLFMPRFEFEVAKVSDGKGAANGGVKEKDKILGINDEATPFFSDFTQKISAFSDKDVTLKVLRGQDTIKLQVKTDANGKIGVQPLFGSGIELARKTYSITEAFAKGPGQAVGVIGNQLKGFGKMFRGEIKASQSVGGFASIADTFGNTWIWERFWFMTATLSMILAFMNLLPIPALDGGHVVFLLFEVITGRKPSDKFLEKSTTIGFILLLSLLLYANGMDVVRHFFK